jgi:RNA polymerase sigma factor (sigma-70 family)
MSEQPSCNLGDLGKSLGRFSHVEKQDSDYDDEDSGRTPNNSFNQVGQYLHQISRVPLLTKEEERMWFQIIDASSAKMRDIFSRYAFVAEMLLRELHRLENGDLHFDSVISDTAKMRCSTYKKQIPDLCRGLSQAADRLFGAHALVQAIGEDAKVELQQARENMLHQIQRLAFRQAVVEDLCDIAYEDVYQPYMECRLRMERSSDDKEAMSRISDFEAMFGMSPDDFISSFSEMRNILKVIHTARAKIVESNMRLVVHVAKKYVNRGLELADLLQDGSIGLMTAVRKFDILRGHKFSTYATWWIRQTISRSLANNSRTIRVPSHMVDMLSKMNTVEKKLQNDLGRAPSDDEIASSMRVKPERIPQLRELRQQVVSLDATISDDNDATIGEMTSDTNTESPIDVTERHILQESVRAALSMLNEREQMVVSMRYGLSDGVQRTLDEIGHVFNVTREHIRKLEMCALDKLRTSNRLKVLAELAGG